MQFQSLTGIRAVAAWWVAVYHVTQVPALLPAHAVFSAGYLGVDLFFVLSGFIISHRYLDALHELRLGDYARYLWLRFARLYPLHLATLLLLAAIVGGGALLGMRLHRPEQFSAGHFVRHLLLAQVPFGDEVSLLSWNHPAWSVSAEFIAYLFFPAFAVLLGRWSRPMHGLVGAILGYVVMLFVRPHVPLIAELVRVLSEFGAGCCIYALYRTGRVARWPWWQIGAASLGLALIVGTVLAIMRVGGFWVVPAFGVAILALAHSESMGALGPLAWLASRSLVTWGTWSYSLYLVHYPVILVLGTAFERMGAPATPLWAGITAGAFFFAMAIAAAGAYRFVEEPSRRWLRAHPPPLGVGR